MAFGFGAGSDMQHAYDSNRNQLKRGKKGLNDLRETYNGVFKKNNQPTYTASSPEAIEALRHQFREEKRRDTMKALLISALVAVALSVLIYLILF